MSKHTLPPEIKRPNLIPEWLRNEPIETIRAHNPDSLMSKEEIKEYEAISQTIWARWEVRCEAPMSPLGEAMRLAPREIHLAAYRVEKEDSDLDEALAVCNVHTVAENGACMTTTQIQRYLDALIAGYRQALVEWKETAETRKKERRRTTEAERWIRKILASDIAKYRSRMEATAMASTTDDSVHCWEFADESRLLMRRSTGKFWTETGNVTFA